MLVYQRVHLAKQGIRPLKLRKETIPLPFTCLLCDVRHIVLYMCILYIYIYPSKSPFYPGKMIGFPYPIPGWSCQAEKKWAFVSLGTVDPSWQLKIHREKPSSRPSEPSLGDYLFHIPMKISPLNIPYIYIYHIYPIYNIIYIVIPLNLNIPTSKTPLIHIPHLHRSLGWSLNQDSKKPQILYHISISLWLWLTVRHGK